MDFQEWCIERDNLRLYFCSFKVETPVAVVQIAHGMGEHIGRYSDFAKVLNEAQISVYGADHRGHGKSCQSNQRGNMGPNGWSAAVSDMQQLGQKIKHDNPDVPVILFAHSMGSMLAQQLLPEAGSLYQAVILSGSPGFVSGSLSFIGKLIARFESWRMGKSSTSPTLEKMLFADANKPFQSETANGYEWLSRNKESVQKYIEDDDCGFVVCNQNMLSLFQSSALCSRDEHLSKISKDLPIWVLSGANDPLHNNQKNLHKMLDEYKKQQLTVSLTLYQGGRHEMLNETNNEDVHSDIVAYIKNLLDEKKP